MLIVSLSRMITASSRFRLETAYRMAAATELAYEGPQAVERTAIDRWKASRFAFIDVEATQCYVVADETSVIVCFRGSEPDRLEDWLADLDVDFVNGPTEGRVHAGFYDALSYVWCELDQIVRRLLKERPRRLLVAGHSLGAALATLGVARWHRAGIPISEVFLFGQPRTGDREFARHFDFALRPITFRIVNDHDIVTRTPPRSLGYRHLGTFIYLTDNGELTDDVGWWQQFLDGWKGAFESILTWGGGGIEEHRMTFYRQRIKQALERSGGRRTEPSAVHEAGTKVVPLVPPAPPRPFQHQAPRLQPRRRAA